METSRTVQFAQWVIDEIVLNEDVQAISQVLRLSFEGTCEVDMVDGYSLMLSEIEEAQNM